MPLPSGNCKLKGTRRPGCHPYSSEASISRKRILFLAEGATMAHFVRPLALADSLDTSRYDVHFMPRRDSSVICKVSRSP